jgi:hypothetical protein
MDLNLLLRPPVFTVSMSNHSAIFSIYFIPAKRFHIFYFCILIFNFLYVAASGNNSKIVKPPRRAESIKNVGSCAPKTANFKIFLLLFSHRVTRTERRETIAFFASIAHVRPIKKGTYSKHYERHETTKHS